MKRWLAALVFLAPIGCLNLPDNQQSEWTTSDGSERTQTGTFQGGGDNECNFDSQCPSGDCSFGKCSAFAKLGSCTVDSDCPGTETCVASSCSSTAAPNNAASGCAFDSQCPGGSCQFGQCSPFPP